MKDAVENATGKFSMVVFANELLDSLVMENCREEPAVTEGDLEELGRQIKEGFRSGRLDSEGKHIAWTLELTVWADDDDGSDYFEISC